MNASQLTREIHKLESPTEKGETCVVRGANNCGRMKPTEGEKNRRKGKRKMGQEKEQQEKRTTTREIFGIFRQQL